MLIKYVAENSWDIVGIYSDDDFSGTDRSRPAFNRLLRDAKEGKFDIVLCKSQSRFTRELELTEKYIHTLFPALGIRFVSLVDNGDTDDRGNKKSRQINALVNEWFLEELSESIRSVLTSRREQGLHIGSFAPYGYMKDPNAKGHLVIDPEASAVVRKIYNLYLAGYGKQRIARTLNDAGIPNPTEYKRLHGFVRNKNQHCSPLWSYFTITDILTNEVYIGNMVQGKSGTTSYKTQKKVSFPREQWLVVNGTHEPIINMETWDKTQALIKSKFTQTPKQPDGIFARKIHCMSCGLGMSSVKNGEKRGFKCERHALSRNYCDGAFISLRKLERIVLAEIQMLSAALMDVKMLEEGIDPFPQLLPQRESKMAEISALKQKLKCHQPYMKKLYVQKLRNQLTEEEYLNRRISATKDRDNAVFQITELTKQIADIGTALKLTADKKGLIAKYMGVKALNKEMVSMLIDYIEIGKHDPASKTTPIVIHWNF